MSGRREASAGCAALELSGYGMGWWVSRTEHLADGQVAELIVGAAGIELPSSEPESSRNVAKTSESASANSSGATVGDDSCGPEAVPASPVAVPADADDAIFAAYKVAKAAADVDRAVALLALLSLSPAAAGPASVTPLALMRVKARRT